MIHGLRKQRLSSVQKRRTPSGVRRGPTLHAGPAACAGVRLVDAEAVAEASAVSSARVVSGVPTGGPGAVSVLGSASGEAQPAINSTVTAATSKLLIRAMYGAASPS
ncbi:MAG: hypothetical protein ACRDO7_00330 [Nocardioidaceae bacterium]